jgi:protocatechuate 3,4-dioxygenase beta subunit
VNRAVTDEAGNFRFLLVPPGNYAIEAGAPGFKTFRREGIIVEVDR